MIGEEDSDDVLLLGTFLGIPGNEGTQPIGSISAAWYSSVGRIGSAESLLWSNHSTFSLYRNSTASILWVEDLGFSGLEKPEAFRRVDTFTVMR